MDGEGAQMIGVIGPNATGWVNLTNGALIAAAFELFDTALAGWTVGILFFIFQFMLILKARNLTLNFITGIFFASLYLTSTFVTAGSAQIIFVMLVFELAGILYLLIWK